MRRLTGRLTRRACLGALGGLAWAAGTTASADEANALERVRQRGTLTVGVYQDLPPFHMAGRGIEVALAEALAAALGVKASLLPFPAGETMEDDLRNMVTRGHYLGWGPADVLMHVPVDPAFAAANPRVAIFGPYWRETVVIARRRERIPELGDFTALADKKVAVPGKSLAGWLLLGADGGRLRDRLNTQFADGVEAAQALVKGDFDAVAGLKSEIESVLRGDERFVVSRLPGPRSPREVWAVGMAVKKESPELAQALQAALDDLAQDGRLRNVFQAEGLAWQRI